MSPVFLTVDEVLELHEYQISHFGGDPGILNPGLLESAVAQAAQQFDGRFLHPDMQAMAAAYLFHIVRNHPFADGNKRTGLHAAVTFLMMNGFETDIPVDDGEWLVTGVATGRVSKEQVIDRMRLWVRPVG